MKQLIILSGKAGSGKDTVADILVNLFHNKKIKRIALADRVKIISREFIHLFTGTYLPLEYFYDQIEKEKERPELGFLWINNKKYIFTIRLALISIGTDILRNYYDDKIWLNYIKDNVLNQDYDILIITDGRMPNEIEYLRNINNHKTTIIKIIRNHENSKLDVVKNHASEKDINNLYSDIIIENNGTLKNLENMIKKIKFEY